MRANRYLLSFAAAAALAAGAGIAMARAEAPDPAAVIDTYGDIAAAMYEDSLTAAQQLQAAVDAFRTTPRSPRRATPGRRRAFPTCRARVFASEMPLSTTGKAR
jgi:putative iron-regulated protein